MARAFGRLQRILPPFLVLVFAPCFFFFLLRFLMHAFPSLCNVCPCLSLSVSAYLPGFCFMVRFEPWLWWRSRSLSVSFFCRVFSFDCDLCLFSPHHSHISDISSRKLPALLNHAVVRAARF